MKLRRSENAWSYSADSAPSSTRRTQRQANVLENWALIWRMLWSWLRTLGKAQRQRSTARTIALSFSGPRVSAESPGQHGCSELSSTEPLEFPGYEMDPDCVESDHNCFGDVFEVRITSQNLRGSAP